jgi:hypothetical protein
MKSAQRLPGSAGWAGLAAAIALGLSACGGGGSGSTTGGGGGPSGPALYFGYLVDAPAQNVYYTTAPYGFHGYTDAGGTFSFAQGDLVSFYLPYTQNGNLGYIPLGDIYPSPPGSTGSFVSALSLPCGAQVATVLQALNTATLSGNQASATAAPGTLILPGLPSLATTDVTNITRYLATCGANAGVNGAPTPQSLLASAQSDAILGDANLVFGVNLSNLTNANNLVTNAPGFAASGTYPATTVLPTLSAFLSGQTVLALSTVTTAGTTGAQLPAATQQAAFISNPSGGAGTAWSIAQSTDAGFNAANGLFSRLQQAVSGNTVTSYLTGDNGTNSSFPSTPVNTLKSSYADSYRAYFQLNQTDSSVAYGQYYLVGPRITSSQLANTAFQVHGFATCAGTGQPPVYVFSANGSQYLSYCATTTPTSSSAVFGGGTVNYNDAAVGITSPGAANATMPNVITLTGTLCADSGNTLYMGALYGQALSTSGSVNPVGFISVPASGTPGTPGGVAEFIPQSISGGTAGFPYSSPTCGG